MQSRPQTLADVATRADSLAHFGRELADWLHTVRTLGARPALVRAITAAPARLAGKFAEGALADATLAAYADFLAGRNRTAPPAWCFEPERIAAEPWFAVQGPRSRFLALRETPPAFKRRNLFTSAPDLPVRLRRSRPAVNAEAKRAKNAERQHRFQLRRRELVRELVHASGAHQARPFRKL